MTALTPAIPDADHSSPQSFTPCCPSACTLLLMPLAPAFQASEERSKVAACRRRLDDRCAASRSSKGMTWRPASAVGLFSDAPNAF